MKAHRFARCFVVLVSVLILAIGEIAFPVASHAAPNCVAPCPATNYNLSYPYNTAADSAGNIYIADIGNNVVEKVTPSGGLSIYAGTGNHGQQPYSRSGRQANRKCLQR